MDDHNNRPDDDIVNLEEAPTEMAKSRKQAIEGASKNLLEGQINSDSKSAEGDPVMQPVASRNPISKVDSRTHLQTLDPQAANDYATGAPIALPDSSNSQDKIKDPAQLPRRSRASSRQQAKTQIDKPGGEEPSYLKKLVESGRPFPLSKPSSRYTKSRPAHQTISQDPGDGSTPEKTTNEEHNPLLGQISASHLRHQSIDVLNSLKDYSSTWKRQNQLTTISGDPGAWGQPSKMSGYTFQNRSPLIQEVQNNNFGKVGKMVGSYIIGSNTSSTVAGMKVQQMNRYMRNSFQPGLMEREKQKIHRSSSKVAQSTDHPCAVGPKTKANVPKPLVLYQLSKHMDTIVHDRSVFNSMQLQGTGGQPLAPGSIPPLDNNTTTGKSTQVGEGNQSRIQHSSIDYTHNRSPFIGNSQKFIQTKQFSTLGHQNNVQNTQTTSINDPTMADYRNKNSTVLIHDLGKNSSRPPVMHSQPSTTPALTTFHITDLLEKSIVHGSQDLEQNKLKQIVDFYKRSVKGDREMSHRSEIMIRNYRLHYVKDPAREGIDDHKKSLFTLNKGTSIHVSNSILRPEIHKFGTQVSSKLTEVYPFLNQASHRYDDPEMPSSQGIERFLKPRHRRAGSQIGTKSFKSNTYFTEGREQGYSESQVIRLGDFLESSEGPPNWQEETSKALETQVENRNSRQGFFKREPSLSKSIQKISSPKIHQIKEESVQQPPEFSTTGISSRPITANDAIELQIQMKTNRIFDRWLRCIVSRATSIAPESPERTLLKNGKIAAPRINDINWAIALSNRDAIKERPLPIERMTLQSFYDERPYQHLQMLIVNADIREWYSKFVLKTSTVKTFSQIVSHDLQSMNFQDSKVAIDFARHHLTHLDPVVFREDKIPLELFTDFEKWIQPLVLKMKKMKKEKELDTSYQGVPGQTYYNFSDGSRRNIPIFVCDFDPYSQKFFVQNKDLGVATWRSRLYICLDSDHQEDLDRQKQESMRQREQSLHYLRVHRLITSEMLKRYGYLKMPPHVLQNIHKRIYVSLHQYDIDSVKKVILQVEALFIFAIMKSVLDSQRLDPFVKSFLVSFKVPLDSPALSYFQCKRWDKPELQGLSEFNQKAIKIELDQNSIMLTDEKYIKLPVFLNQLTESTIGAYKLFSWPFDTEALFAQRSKEFSKLKRDDIDRIVNSCPMKHANFVNAQKVMSKYFHHLAKYKWVELIAKQITSYVQDDFEFDQGNCITEEQIDPSLLRIFFQLKMYMQTVIFDHFEDALRDYTKFLLGFILREPHVKDTQVIDDIKFNPKIDLRIRKNTTNFVPLEGEPLNDIDLIRLRKTPFIMVNSLIEDVAVTNKLIKKQKITTKPDLEQIHKDLFSVISDMHGSLEQIDRIDGIVFPLLKLWSPFLMIPDVKNNEALTSYIQIIGQLLDQSMKSTKKELGSMNTFMPIFEKKTTNIIFDLKRASLKLQQELGMAEEEEEEGADFSRSTGNLAGTSFPATPQGAIQKLTPDKNKRTTEAVPEEEEESYGGDSDEDRNFGDEGYQANDMAFKSVEIDEGLMRDELYSLRNLKWKILDAVRDQYDFGMVHLDCTRFKDKILSHVKDLVDHLENYLRTDFTAKQKNIQQEIVLVRGKLDIEVDSIDDVIMLLDYIESLKTQGNKIGDIEVMIEELVRKMEYMERVEIILPGEQYTEYLHIRNWPRTFRHYIDVRKAELLSKKDNLYQEMSQEVNTIFQKITLFKETIAEVLQMGLVDVDQPQPAASSPSQQSRKSSLLSSLSKDELEIEEEKEEVKKPEKVVKKKQPMFVTFDWLANEIEMEHMRFDFQNIEATYLRIEQLKQEFDDVERATQLINKRESLLSVGKTQFSDLKIIQDILKPLYELWQVASKFGQILPEWVEGNFQQLDAVYIEMKVEEWINELRRLQKTTLVQENPKQQELQKFMIDSLNNFQKYTPMLRTLRTKGLAMRHWKMVCQKLHITLDPNSVTLFNLISLKLYDDEKLKTIKQVCEVATKEYSVQQALERLDNEMRTVEFQFETTQDGQTLIITNLPELISLFEEFFLRISVLKTNPNIKNFFEKLLEIEKIIKAVVELVNEWADFQRNFIYLNGIFVLEEIQKALPHESKFFLQVQSLFTFTSQSFQQNPQVYKVNQRENFLNVLVRSNQDCESIRQGLRFFLERRRGKFPRLFFLSNEELIDIFGKGPDLIDAMISGESKGFITNLFEGVENMMFRDETQELTHMQSKDNETIELVREVATQNMKLDQWLSNFEMQMINTIKNAAFLAFEGHGQQEWEEWITTWPSQATYLSSQIWFTMKIEAIFQGHWQREMALKMPPKKIEREVISDDDMGSPKVSSEMDMKSPEEVHVKPKTPMNIDDDEEEQAEDERLYLEDVFRQISKDEVINPERAQIEKIMRFKQRFRINKRLTPGKQFTSLHTQLEEIIGMFTAMVKKRLKPNVRQSTVSLLTCHVYFRDILRSLMDDKVFVKDDFQWQIQFKYHILNVAEVVHRSSYDRRGGQRNFETHKLNVEFEAFGQLRNYGFEYLGNCPRLVVTPLTERCQRSLILALQYNYGGAPEGPFGTGKTETTKDLSRSLAKLCFVMNCSANYKYAGIQRFFKGLASSGAWTCFDEFNRMDTAILSMIAQIIISLQSAIKQCAPHVYFEESKVNLKLDCAVFITLNPPGYAGRTELPATLKALFRPIAMVIPDSEKITEILLYSSGFVGASQLAKKIVSIQNWATKMMKQQGITHDFGLRSIKSIVSIAETLKLQAQNIIESGLTEIIDDKTLGRVPYKTDQIIKDVMLETQSDINREVEEFAKQFEKKSKSKWKQKKKQEESQQNENESQYDQTASPESRRKGHHEFSDVRSTTEGGGLFDKKETTGKDDTLSDSEQEVDDDGKKRLKKGDLYRMLWRKKSVKDRQLRCVYRQIGIFPEQDYDEDELEEYIILKAVRDYNHSKFSQDDHIIIEGIIKDIFQRAVPDLDAPIQDYMNLAAAIDQSFEAYKFDSSKAFRIKVLQFYEIVNTKHGCIFVGSPQSGKTALIQILQTALNKAALNEYMLTVQDLRREQFQKLAAEHQKEMVEQQISKLKNQGKGAGPSSSEMMGAAVKMKARKTDREAQAKKMLATYQDLYRQTKPSQAILDQIKDCLKNKGVISKRMNPKGMTESELFGKFDELSHEWHEGVFSNEFRAFSKMRDTTKKWLILDGPIDYMWVENLNSILDDNRKMSLPNGEQIKMSNGTCVILETNHLRNVTPATVSRCGLIYMHRDETYDTKSLFNQWLRSLPPNLMEYQKEIEGIVNLLIVDAIKVYKDDEKYKRIRFDQINLYWIIKSFIRLLTALIFDYYMEYEKSNQFNMGGQNPNELGDSINQLTFSNLWFEPEEDRPPVIEETTVVMDTEVLSPTSSRAPSQQRVMTPDLSTRDLKSRKRLPRCSFIDSDSRYENAIKYTPIWLEAFIIFSIVWTFFPVLSEPSRRRLNDSLHKKFEAYKQDFAVYQREKKKRMQDKNKDKQSSLNKLSKGQSLLLSQSEKIGSNASTGKKERQQEVRHLGDGLTADWGFIEGYDDRPMLISNFPDKGSIYDFYFCLDKSDWKKFDVEHEVFDAKANYDSLLHSQKKISNFYVPTKDSIRFSYVLECLVTKQTSTLVIGSNCSGRSMLMRNLLFETVFDFTKQLVSEHLTLSQHSESRSFKRHVEGMLEYRLVAKNQERTLRPPEGNKLICYIEDLHLSYTDKYGDQPAIEAIRDYLTEGAWLSSKKRKIRKIENVSFFSCLATDAPETLNVTPRVLHQFNLISLDDFNADSMKQILSIMSNIIIGDSWPSAVHAFTSSITDALLEISQKVFRHLRSTPQKSYYTYCWRDLHKIMYSLQMAEGNAMKKEEHVMKLFYHECLRTYGDRLLLEHDVKWFEKKLKEVCKKHFNVADDVHQLGNWKMKQTEVDGVIKPIRPFLWPIKNPSELYFSHWNQEVEGFYMEVENVDKTQLIIEKHLERFNDSNERIRVDLILYKQLCRQMLKILRIIQTPGGHLVNVALKGYGMKSAIRLVTFTTGYQLREIELHEGYSNDEWKSELRRTLLACGVDDKPTTFYIDEYKMAQDNWYSDLICIIKNNIQSDITRKQDILNALQVIHKDVEKERRRMRYGLQAEDVKQEGQSSSERKTDRDDPMQEEQGARLFQKFPYVQAELYRIFLNRIKTNFHLVFQYSPSGPDFRKKIRKHKELLSQSQILFMKDLPSCELEMLGKGFIKNLQAKIQEKRQAEGGNEKKKQLAWNDKETTQKVLHSIVKMYLYSQEMAKRYSEEQKHNLLFTPVHFLRIFECYQRLLTERSVVVKEISNRYEAGLKKIKQTQDAIYSYHQELERQQPILQNRMRQLYRIINDIEEEYKRIKSQSDQLKRDEFEAENQTDHALKIKDQCEDTLNKIIPALNQSMNSIESLNKYDIAELRSMKKPPKVVKLVLQIVCLFLGVPPVEKKSKKTGKIKKSYWKAALGREVLGNPRLPQALIEFDRNKVTAEVMFEVEEVLLNPDYSFEKAYTASTAATGLFKWVKTTRDYFYIFKEIEPRRDAFMLSQKQYNDKLTDLQEKQARITQLDNALVGLKEHQQSKDSIIVELQAKIQECSSKKKRADVLLRGLSSEKQKWIVCMRMLSSKYSSVTGDVLLTSGYITMLSCFGQLYRNMCIQKWSKDLIEDGLQVSSEFVFSELFGDSYKIRRWHQNHLPTDTMSVNNALVIEKTKQFSYLIDPQFQGVTWLKTQSEEAGTLMLLAQFDSQFKKMMEMAVEMGKTVIIEEVGDEIGMNLQSIIKKQISKFGGQRMINFCRKQYKYDKNFRLFIVSSDLSPELDVNITNHVTVVNFSINLESLQSQMLAMVVMNERSDLENTFSENSKEAFESIKSLKQIEQAILLLLEAKVSDLLGDENLILTLEESKNTAEYVALKLKNITATNQFIEKSRDVYTPVAFRASVLYFFAQDLQKLNHMYQFSLGWFKSIFKKSLQLTNTIKNNLHGVTVDPDRDRTASGSPLYKGYQFTIEERIELLTQTFTQEFCKKIQMAVFEEDRRLITCMLALRIMQSEGLLDQPLYNFMIEGAPSINPKAKIPETVDPAAMPWMNNMIWEDLQELCKLKPFNEENLLQHIQQYQPQWTEFFRLNDEPMNFYSLPNFYLLERDIQKQLSEEFKQYDYTRKESLRRQGQGHDYKFGKSARKGGGDTLSNEDGETFNSEKPSSASGMIRSESEILNDPEIWQVTDSEADEDDYWANEIKKTEETQGNQKTEPDEQVATQEQEVAKYLVDVSPAITKSTPSHTFLKKCTSTLNWKQKREKVIQVLSELCVIRCLRQDQLNDGVERLIRIVLDTDYYLFKCDIISCLNFTKNEKPKQSDKFSKHAISRANFTGDSWISNNSAAKKSSHTFSQMDPSQSKGQEGSNPAQTQNSGSVNYAQSGHKRLKNKGDSERYDKEKDRSEKKGGLNNINNLISDAFNDSDAKSPILFLMVHSVNIFDLIGDFLKKSQPAGAGSAKLQYCTLGQGLEDSVEATLASAAYNGDWILLENLHLVQDWLQVLEDTITKWRTGPDLNPRFRLWATCSPTPEFPQTLLNRAIKVAIQPPRSIKAQVGMMVKIQARDQFFRKSGKHSNFHKNIFFSLVYLHAILQGRKTYGTLGWNIPYKFDITDFEIGNSQISYQMKSLPSSRQARADCISMLRYFFSEINYGGKIQRVQDQITLEALVDDLINEHMSMVTSLEPNYEQSHSGFPADNCPDFAKYFENKIPDIDPYEMLGFNYNMFSHLLGVQAQELFGLIDKVEKSHNLQNRPVDPDALKSSIKTQALRIILRNASEKSQDLRKTLEDKESLLNHFVELEKVLQNSSMYLTKETSPFMNSNLSSKVFEKRDLSDMKVLEVATEILNLIDKKYPFESMIEKFPILYDSPLNIVINRELHLYRVLVTAIRDSVENIINYIFGRQPKSFEVEQLWYYIKDNRVPERWLRLGYATAHTSLAIYLSELSLKLDFWIDLTNHEGGSQELQASYWLPAFHFPEAFLNAVAQSRSRAEIVPIKELANEYQVQDFMTVPSNAPQDEDYCLYFHGLWLEGAQWNLRDQMLEETRSRNRFLPFPVIKLSAVRRRDVFLNMNKTDLTFADDAVLSPAETQSKRARQASLGPLKRKTMTRGGKPRNAEETVHSYMCPVFKSTRRLADLDSEAVEYLSLPTLQEPRKWIKRGVALVLEPDNY